MEVKVVVVVVVTVTVTVTVVTVTVTVVTISFWRGPAHPACSRPPPIKVKSKVTHFGGGVFHFSPFSDLVVSQSDSGHHIYGPRKISVVFWASVFHFFAVFGPNGQRGTTSAENFSIERPIFVAPPPPPSPNGGTQTFYPAFRAISNLHFFSHHNIFSEI